MKEFDDALYAVKYEWFYCGREEAKKLAKKYARVFDYHPIEILEKARKIKL